MDIHTADFKFYQLIFNVMSSLFTSVLFLGVFFSLPIYQNELFLFSECLPVGTWQQWQV